MNKKTTSKKLLALLLTLVMVLGMLPMTAFAASYSPHLCVSCGEYKEETCDGCCICIDCLLNDGGHCVVCGNCLEGDADRCHDSYMEGDGYLCEDCCWDANNHCEECGLHAGADNDIWCPYAGQGSHCITCIESEGGGYCNACGELYCPFCENFEFCPDCGYCELCNEADFGSAYCTSCGDCLQCKGGEEHFCPSCYACEDCADLCVSCGESCNLCTQICGSCSTCEYCADVICPSCGDKCSECAPDELCQTCGYCSDCVILCSDCGEVCVECAEDVCEDCGRCNDCVDDFCEYCGLCVECCAEYSECSEGMCVEDPEYDDHFCQNCFQCFHDADPCDTCVLAGEYYCEDCCKEAAEDAGCDCDEDERGHIADLQQHMDDVHNGEEVGSLTHQEEDAPRPSSRWTFDETHHWHECRACDPDAPFESHIEKVVHNYNTEDVCTECGYQKNTGIVIQLQPRSVTGLPVVPADAWPSDALGYRNNKATFSVTAKSVIPNTELSYQWYVQYKRDGETLEKALEDKYDFATDYDGVNRRVDLYKGTDSSELTVSTAECQDSGIRFFCEISDDRGHTLRTNVVRFSNNHVFEMQRHDNKQTGNPEVLYTEVKNIGLGENSPFRVKNDFGVETTLKPATTTGYHCRECLGDGCHEMDESSKEPHTMGEVTDSGYSRLVDGNWVPLKQQRCTVCGWTAYFTEHTHNFRYDPYGRTEETHLLKCTKCDVSKIEPHNFGDWTVTSGGTLCRSCACGERIYIFEKNSSGGVHYVVPSELDDNDYVLLSVQGGSLDKNFAKWGDTVTLTADANGKVCHGLSIYGAVSDHGEAKAYPNEEWGDITHDAENPMVWEYTLPDVRPDNYPDQDPYEIITMLLQFLYAEETCNHKVYDEISGTYSEELAAVLVDRVEPSCAATGYSGDKICQRCGALLEKGSVLPKLREHVYDAEHPKDEHWTGNWYDCEVCGAEDIFVPADKKFNVNVISGQATVGSSKITKAQKGTEVTITADPAPEGKVFYRWYVRGGSGFTLADASKPTTSFVMPMISVTVEAVYLEPSRVNPFLISGDGSIYTKGSTTGLTFVSSAPYEDFDWVEIDGEEISIRDECRVSEGSTIVYVFPDFLDEYINVGEHRIEIYSQLSSTPVIGNFTVKERDPSDPGTTPGGDLTEEYDIYVISGYASIGAGAEIFKAVAGTEVTITANPAPAGKVFDKWVIKSDAQPVLANANDPTTTFTLPKHDVVIEATYKDAPTTPGDNDNDDDTSTVPGDDTPSQPGDDTPSQPGDDTPSQPGDDTPSQPGDDTPSQPGDDTPSQPGDDPTQPGTDPTSPQTGDNSHLLLWVALMFVAGIGVVATTVLGKKKGKYSR